MKISREQLLHSDIDQICFEQKFSGKFFRSLCDQVGNFFISIEIGFNFFSNRSLPDFEDLRPSHSPGLMISPIEKVEQVY